jgi:hypothetical protein
MEERSAPANRACRLVRHETGDERYALLRSSTDDPSRAARRGGDGRFRAGGRRAAAPAPVPDPGNTTWMLVSSALVLLMTIPGLALFYGGLVRAKNMLSVLMQVFAIAAVVMIVWVVYGYSMAFGDGGNAFIGGFGKMFLAGVTPASLRPPFPMR